MQEGGRETGGGREVKKRSGKETRKWRVRDEGGRGRREEHDRCQSRRSLAREQEVLGAIGSLLQTHPPGCTWRPAQQQQQQQQQQTS